MSQRRRIALKNITTTIWIGRLHCYYRQPDITQGQFAYLAIYLVLNGNVAAQEARTERLIRGSDQRLYNLQFGKMRLPDSETAVVIYIEPVRQANDRQWPLAEEASSQPILGIWCSFIR